MVLVADVMWNDETEDWPKRSWDFHMPDGSPVDNLADLEAVSGRAQEAWIHDLLHLPVGRGAPRKLIEEALSRAGS